MNRDCTSRNEPERTPRILPGALLTAATLLVGVRALAAAEPQRVLVERTTSSVIEVLRNDSLSAEEKRRRILSIVDAAVDFDTLSRLVLARHWAALTEEQRREFTQEFKQHLSITYGRNVERYDNERVETIGDRQEARGDWTVQTRIVRTGAEPIVVDYRLREIGERWRIIDVVIEGVSLVSNFRSQFQRILASGGIEKLLDLLKKKNATGEPLKAGVS